MPEDYEDDPEDLDRPPAFFPYDADEDSNLRGADYGEPVEVSVEGVFYAETGGAPQRFVVLSSGDRKLPMMIGGPEAVSISIPLEGTQPDRPLTHDLMKAIMERLGGTLEKVVVDDLWNKVFYAKLFIRVGKESLTVDSRPSDAIALALRCGVPIYVSEGILEQGEE